MRHIAVIAAEILAGIAPANDNGRKEAGASALASACENRETLAREERPGFSSAAMTGNAVGGVDEPAPTSPRVTGGRNRTRDW